MVNNPGNTISVIKKQIESYSSELDFSEAGP